MKINNVKVGISKVTRDFKIGLSFTKYRFCLADNRLSTDYLLIAFLNPYFGNVNNINAFRTNINDYINTTLKGE